MNTYSDEEILMISDITNAVTGEGDNYNLQSLIEERTSMYPDNREGAIECSLVEYFSFAISELPTSDYDAVREQDIYFLVFNAPLSELPKHINDSGPSVVKQIIAKWRLMLGR